MKILHLRILKLITFDSYFVFLNEIELKVLLIIPNDLFYITKYVNIVFLKKNIHTVYHQFLNVIDPITLVNLIIF